MPSIRVAWRLVRALASPPERSDMLAALRSRDMLGDAECLCCGYRGRFNGFGRPVRIGAQCPSCESLERHRLLRLVHRRGILNFAGRDVLHFAPEPFVSDLVRGDGPRAYTTADIEPGRADLVLNLEQIDRPSDAYDLIVASHVLEHVDDRKAMAELHRILRPGGKLVAMVPLVEGWGQTYENPELVSEADRLHHFLQEDHVRLYGADFPDRLRSAGFTVEAFHGDGIESVRYRLQRGEKVFIATKA